MENKTGSVSIEDFEKYLFDFQKKLLKADIRNPIAKFWLPVFLMQNTMAITEIQLIKLEGKDGSR